MPKRKPILITTPYPNLSDLARFLNISPKREKELAVLADQIKAEWRVEDEGKPARGPLKRAATKRKQSAKTSRAAKK